MSVRTMKLLPDGVEGIVEKITQLGSTKFIQISQHLLERIPDIVDFADVLNVEERERLLGSLQTDPASELAVFLTISELWKNIAYYQPKLQPLLESLKEAGFDAEMRSTIVKIWSESGLTVSDRLRNISFSGRSNVRDVGWTLRKNVASSDNLVIRATEAILQFDTDRGSKIIELNRSRLIELYITLQEIQKNLDILLER
uniref:COMM domain-containing protein n=1 Tax=Onchocerca volvulus TaxID=6282 RepID=A0A8R1TW15_ONCVO